MLPVSKAEDDEIPKKHSTRVEGAGKFPILWWRPSLVAVPRVRALADAVPFATVTFRSFMIHEVRYSGDAVVHAPSRGTGDSDVARRTDTRESEESENARNVSCIGSATRFSK
jgi:hypothetical protein